MLKEFIRFRDLIQLYHWHTRDYARHVASGNLYDKIQTSLDTFVEVLQKNGDRLKVSGNIKLQEMDDDDIVDLLEDFLDFLSELEDGFDRRSDLLNILADMTEAINQTLYLFTLN